jgi:hypothetical protein
MISTSKNRASIGRVLLVFALAPLAISSDDAKPPVWDGPQPGLVVGGPFIDGDKQLVNVNPMIDAANFPDVLKAFRERGQGNTLTSIPLFDALSNEQRQQLHESGISIWAEWPPVPSATGPSPIELVYRRLDEITKRIDAFAIAPARPSDGRTHAAIRALAKHICNDGTTIDQDINNILDGVSTSS